MGPEHGHPGQENPTQGSGAALRSRDGPPVSNTSLGVLQPRHAGGYDWHPPEYGIRRVGGRSKDL